MDKYTDKPTGSNPYIHANGDISIGYAYTTAYASATKYRSSTHASAAYTSATHAGTAYTSAAYAGATYAGTAHAGATYAGTAHACTTHTGTAYTGAARSRRSVAVHPAPYCNKPYRKNLRTVSGLASLII
jgi:hypothetical protein